MAPLVQFTSGPYLRIPPVLNSDLAPTVSSYLQPTPTRGPTWSLPYSHSVTYFQSSLLDPTILTDTLLNPLSRPVHHLCCLALPPYCVQILALPTAWGSRTHC